ncbi:MAG: hypothetical protein RLN79_14075 [Cytophagales bacterium]
MKILLFTCLISFSFLTCTFEKEQDIVPQSYEDLDMGINRECFSDNLGEDCFVMDIDTMYVDTLRSNLLKVFLNGDYNSSINPISIFDISSKFYAYKNGNEVNNLSLAKYSTVISEDRWSLSFNYGYFSGYDSLKSKVRMVCYFDQIVNGQEKRTYLFSEYTKLITYKPQP